MKIKSLKIIALAVIVIVISCPVKAQDTISVMYYNLLNFPGTTPERADTLKIILQHLKPDVLLVNELSSEAGADLVLTLALNQNGIDYYNRANYIDGYDSDNLLFYNSQKFALYSQSEIATDLRDINEYVLYALPVNADTIFIHFYAGHLKSSTGTDNESKRASEALSFKNHLDLYPEIGNVLFGGDMNFYTSNEPAFDVICNTGSVSLYDPIQMEGDWNDNPDFASIHTQSTRSTQFGGGATGGMDDRFDLVFVSGDIMNGTNHLKYIENSYHAVGQDGQRLNQSLISPENNSEPDSVISALYYMSDHLPVWMQLELQNASISAAQLSVSDLHLFCYKNVLHIQKLREPGYCHIYNDLGSIVFSCPVYLGDNKVILPNSIPSGLYYSVITGNKTHFSRAFYKQ